MSEMSTTLHVLRALDRVPVGLLQLLLHLHAAALREAGLEPTTLDPSALSKERERLPSSLLDDLHAVHLLSDEAGHSQLVEQMVVSGLPVPCDALPEVLAMTLRVEQPALFRRALEARSLEASCLFYELRGRCAVEPTLTDASLRDLERRLCPFFGTRGLPGLCEIQAWRESDAVCFRIQYAQHLRRELELVNGSVVARDRHPVSEAVVVLHPQSARLRLSAQHVAFREALRTRFGDWLAGDPEWFVPDDVVSLAPLVDRTEEVLTPTPGLLHVRIAGLDLLQHGPNAGVLCSSGENAMAVLRDCGLRPGRSSRVRSVRLTLQHASDQVWRSVTVGASGRVTGDWRVDRVTRRYLEARGFLVSQPRRKLA